MLKDKFTIETFPITKKFVREKRLLEDRGELVLLADGEQIKHITFFTLNPGPNFFWGGHFHKQKIEKVYVISGKLRMFLKKDVATHEKDIIEVTTGQRVTIYPMCAHKFQAITPSQVIVYCATSYNAVDDIKFNDFDGVQQWLTRIFHDRV
nr:hypothetical protein [Desulfobacterales bacterium]